MSELKRQLRDQERVLSYPHHTTQYPTPNPERDPRVRGGGNIPHTAERILDQDSRNAVQGMSPSEMSMPTAVVDWREGRGDREDREGKEEKKGVSVTPSKSAKNDNKKELKMISDRNKMIAEHRSMQEELMRTSDALETLQQLIKDRDKTNTRREKTLLAEKESLLKEAHNATSAYQNAKDEVKHLLRERDYMVRSLNEFSHQLFDLVGENDQSILSPIKDNAGINSPSDIRTASTSTPNATLTSTSSHAQAVGETDDNPDNLRYRELYRIETDGAVELDGVIRSMQSVVNDRKRVRRLCRHQQLSIMALR